MSLVVWLPLTKDLRNQGLSDVTVTNSGATFNSAGKLGGCYYFNRSIPNYLKITNPLTTTMNGVSMAFWVKLPSNGSVNDQLVHIGNGSGWTNNRFTCFVRGGNSTLIFACGDGTNSTQYNCASSALTLNQWTHVICLYKNNKMEIYLDGVLDKEYSTTIVPSFTNVAYVGVGAGPNVTEPATAYLNDVRIYDHALSQLEVKQLAQGLILHYPLNRQGFGQDNLATCTTPQYNLTAGTGNYNYFWVCVNGTLTVGETYTFSAEIEVSGGVDKCTIYNYHSSPSSHGGPRNDTFPADGKRHSWTFVADSTGFIVYSGIAGAAANKTATAKNIKIEKGDKATPYIPRSNETLYTTMGLNGTTEYDTSGYCNNLNKNGTYSYTSDTPKYAVSTIFNGTEWMNGVTPGAEIKTLVCWAKTSKNKSTSQFMVADSTSNMCISFYSGCIIGVFGYTRSTGSKCTLGTSYKENDWNHFVVVKTGDAGERAIYCNGELLTPTANDYWSVAAGFFIGSRNNSGTLPFHGQICDVRAYATALSATDVKSLYQNSATIDADGTIHGAIR